MAGIIGAKRASDSILVTAWLNKKMRPYHMWGMKIAVEAFTFDCNGAYLFSGNSAHSAMYQLAGIRYHGRCMFAERGRNTLHKLGESM